MRRSTEPRRRWAAALGITALVVTGGGLLGGPAQATATQGLFGRTLLERALTKPPAELLPRQQVRLTETWDGAPQLDRAEVELTATAKGTRESATVTFLAVPWLLAGLLAVLVAAGSALWARAPADAVRVRPERPVTSLARPTVRRRGRDRGEWSP